MRLPLKETSRTQNPNAINDDHVVDEKKNIHDESYTEINNMKDCDSNCMAIKTKQECYNLNKNNGEKDKMHA